MSPTRLTLAFALLGTLLLGTAAFFGFERAAHGLDIAVEARTGESFFPVHHGFEPRPLFANRHRLNAILVQKWNFRAHPVPDARVSYRVTLRGQVEVPAGATWSLRARPVRGTHVRIESPARELAAGQHPLHVVLEGTFPEDAAVRLEYRDHAIAGSGFARLGVDALSPETPVSLARSPALPWVLGATALFLLCLGLLATREPARFRVRARYVAVLLLLGFGLGVRLFDYTAMPEFKENADELFATWNGFQLLTDGTTRGWSLWAGAYQGRVDIELVPYFDARPFDVIRPYLEHPPLLHLLAGAAAKLGGAQHYLHARLTHTRLVPIALFVPSLLLLFAIARRLFPGTRTPYLAALLYSGLPTLVIQQRVVKEEALLTPMALLGIYLFLRWDAEDPKHNRLIWLAAFVTGLGALAKVPGAFFLPPLVLLFFLRGGLRPALIACAGGVLGLLPLFLYGAYVDFDLFVFSTVHQASGRPAHWNLFPRFFADGLINHNLVGHGHMLFVWLGYALALGKLDGPRRAVLSLPLIYLAALALSSGNWTFGWYILPMMPFVCLGAGHFLDDLLDHPSFFGGLLLVTLLVMYGFNFMHDLPWAMEAPGWTELRKIITPFMVVTLTPFIVAEAWPSERSRAVTRFVTGAGLAAFLCSSAYFAVNYETLFTTHYNFDRMVHFDR